jgi:Calmodulin binding protein-like
LQRSCQINMHHDSLEENKMSLAVYKKHHPPVLDDEVWRLEKIGKDGAFHKRLKKQNIKTVKDFLTSLNHDPARLRNVHASYNFY